MSNQIFKIDELLRLVIDELVETSPQTAVSFALTCRSLEEPTLSSLWGEQNSLADLIKVLPDHTWVQDTRGIVSGRDFPMNYVQFKFLQAIEDDPSAEDWTRLHRYASWMRELHLGINETIPADTFSRLVTGSPGGVLCVKLECLRWNIQGTPSASPFFRLFLPPHLKRVSLHSPRVPVISRARLAGLVQIISFLPTSLEDLTVDCGWEEEDETLKDAISAFIRRCGSSLRNLYFRVPLSEAAIRHITQLPNLRSWNVVQGPPRTVPLSIFPSLEKLCLHEEAALPWLYLLLPPEERVPQNASAPATLHTNLGEMLNTLHCPYGTIVDSTLLSSILKLRNLVTLYVGTSCPLGGCTFYLTDGSVENLAATLPRLETLRLGNPCRLNSCKTTIASLLSISTHCLGLTLLEIHFNTLTIAGDMQRMLDGDSWCDNAKCELQNFVVGYLPLEGGEMDVETMVVGFRAIFPCLTDITDYSGRWHELRTRLSV